jgi:hypothetical protein
MPDLSPVLASGAVALLLLVMLSFAIGTQRNIQKGNATLIWLQTGLPGLGRRTNLRWLGSSAVQLDLVEPAEPFRAVTVLVVLEPRDVPLMWLVTRWRGRRDVLIFRTSLRRAPQLDLEATSSAAWLDAPDADEATTWPVVRFAEGVHAAAVAASSGDVAAARRTWDRLSAITAGVSRLSIRRTVPHVEIHLRLAGIGTTPATSVVDAIRSLAVELSRT